MYGLLGRLAVNHSGRFCFAWLALAAGLTTLSPSWRNRAQDDDIHLLPATSPSVRGFRQLERSFPSDAFASRAIVAIERTDRPLSAADFELVDRMISALTELRQCEPSLKIGAIVSYRDGLIGSRMLSADRQSTLIQLALGTPYLAVPTRATVDRAEAKLREVVAAAGGDPPRVYVTGPAGIGRDVTAASGESLNRTTPAAILLVVALLFLATVKPRPAAIRRDDDTWVRTSVWVVARLGWVMFGALAVLLPFAGLGVCVTPTLSPIGDLAPSADSVRGLDAIRRHFTAGEVGPLTVLLAADTDWDGADGRSLIGHLSRGFANLENVAEVRSLTQPLGQPLSGVPAPRSGLLTGLMQWSGPGTGFMNPFKAAKEHYLATCSDDSAQRYVTRLDIVLKSDPFAQESVATLATVETWLTDFLPEQTTAIGPVSADVYGVTVQSRDLAVVSARDRLRANALAAGGVFLILLALVQPLCPSLLRRRQRR